MRMRVAGLALVLLCAPAALLANDPPSIEHQPAICTVPAAPIALCAAVSDDSSVAAARIYFRTVGEKFFGYVNMSFTGLSYCATLPAPTSKNRGIEYYLQAIDDAGEPMRSSTYRLLGAAGHASAASRRSRRTPRARPRSRSSPPTRSRGRSSTTASSRPASLLFRRSSERSSSVGPGARASPARGQGTAGRLRRGPGHRPAPRGAGRGHQPRLPADRGPRRLRRVAAAARCRAALPRVLRRARAAASCWPSRSAWRRRACTRCRCCSSTRSTAPSTRAATRPWPASEPGCWSRSSNRPSPDVRLVADRRRGSPCAARSRSASPAWTAAPTAWRCRCSPPGACASRREPPEVDVPASGTARVQVPLMRAGATRGSQHGVLLVAESRDGLPVRTAVAVAQVEVAGDGGARAALPAVAASAPPSCSWGWPWAARSGGRCEAARRLDTSRDPHITCSPDGQAQGLLPAARRAPGRERHRDQACVPPPDADPRPGPSGRGDEGRSRRAAGGLRDAHRCRAPPALRRPAAPPPPRLGRRPADRAPAGRGPAPAFHAGQPGGRGGDELRRRGARQAACPSRSP